MMVDDTPYAEVLKLDIYSLYASFPLFYILYDKSCMMAMHILDRINALHLSHHTFSFILFLS